MGGGGLPISLSLANRTREIVTAICAVGADVPATLSAEHVGTELEAWRRPTMADTIQRVEYFYAQVANKAGEGSRFLRTLWAFTAIAGR